MRSTTLLIRPTPPFHFDGTVFNPSHFPSNDSRWEPGRYLQTIRWKKANYGLELVKAGTTTRPCIEATIHSHRQPRREIVDEIEREIRWRFDLDSLGIPEFVRQFRQDPYVGQAIRRRPGMRPKSGYSLYEYLVITVLLQNTVVRRSVGMLQALFERYGKATRIGDDRLWAFWDPETIDQAPEEELRSLRLGYRARTLKRQAAQFVNGRIDEATLRATRDKSGLVAALDDIYGVGPQSAWYMLSQFFHFYDALEHVSPWEGRVVSRVIFGREERVGALTDFFTERYGHYRGLAFGYVLMDVFWQHRARPLPWLTNMIRL